MTEWTAEQSDAMAALIAAGRTSGETAEALNKQFGTTYTRNAIIGRASRLKIVRPTRAVAPRYVRKHKPRNVLARVVANNGNYNPVIAPRLSADALKLSCAGIKCETPFNEVTGCWYPNDGSGPHLWCNGPRQEGSSFCIPHHALVWVPPRPSQHKSWRPAA